MSLKYSNFPLFFNFDFPDFYNITKINTYDFCSSVTSPQTYSSYKYCTCFNSSLPVLHTIFVHVYYTYTH